MKAILNVDKEKLIKLTKMGYKEIPPTNQYESLRLTLDEPFKVTMILYSSKKLVVQTKNEKEEAVVQWLNSVGVEAELVPNEEKSKINYESIKTNEVIGSDETLKGDTFGGLVVVAVYANKTIRKKLEALGCKDSKNLDDYKILEIAPKIMITAPYHVENLYPKEYNKYQITPLLNRLHKECAFNIGKSKAKHIVDQYPGCNVGDVSLTKAESKFIEVAAASIIARYYAIKQREELTRRAGFVIPFGSTHVKEALQKLKDSDLNPNDFVKTSFRNVKDFFGNP